MSTHVVDRMDTISAEIAVGTPVRVERDENLYPSRGSWPQFRGRTGTVVEINDDEYGVIFGKVKARTDGRGDFNWSGDECPTWFKSHEITGREGSQCSRKRLAQ